MALLAFQLELDGSSVHFWCPMGHVTPDGEEGILTVNLADGEQLAHGGIPAFGRELGHDMFRHLSHFGGSIARSLVQAESPDGGHNRPIVSRGHKPLWEVL